MARQPRACHYGTMRLWKALGQIFPMATVLEPTLFQLWKFRAWKIDAGVCDILYTVYGREKTSERKWRSDHKMVAVIARAATGTECTRVKRWTRRNRDRSRVTRPFWYDASTWCREKITPFPAHHTRCTVPSHNILIVVYTLHGIFGCPALAPALHWSGLAYLTGA